MNDCSTYPPANISPLRNKSWVAAFFLGKPMVFITRRAINQLDGGQPWQQVLSLEQMFFGAPKRMVDLGTIEFLGWKVVLFFHGKHMSSHDKRDDKIVETLKYQRIKGVHIIIVYTSFT